MAAYRRFGVRNSFEQQLLGYFLFGGSDYIILFQDKAGFEITAPLESEASTSVATYKHIYMGTKYGVMKGSN